MVGRGALGCRGRVDRMSNGNGVDIAAVYQLLTEVAQTVAGHDRKLDAQDRKLDAQDRKLDAQDRKLDAQDRKLNEIIVVVNEHTHKLDELAGVVNRHDRKLDDLTTDIIGLRETLTHYHATVLGHGILYSELDERVRRIERHLKLESATS
jgi:chromosome segregation ATPase